jgi:cell wall-associated NlpC family hydrolase
MSFTWQDQMITIARTWCGTPYIYGAKIKGVGVDCGTFLVEVFREMGFVSPDFQIAKYNKQFNLHAEKSAMEIESARCGLTCVWRRSSTNRNVRTLLQKADLLCWSNGNVDVHVALYCGGGIIIHAAPDIVKEARFVTHTLSSVWRYNR